jgi:hypothetical protein
MLMKEFTANQIAAALVGHPGSAEQELRLLRLFQTPTLPSAPTLPSPASAAGEKEALTLTLPLRGREMRKAA